MQPTSEQLAAAVAAAANQELTKALERIKHCLGQLTDKQMMSDNYNARLTTSRIPDPLR
jgi:hypothetical protein